MLKDSTILSRIRNFYGVLSVCDVLPGDPVQHHRLLQHGGVTHGLQFVNPSRRGIPTAYYGPASGAGLALRHAPRNSPLRVGLVGLGIGTVAAYGQTGDEYRAYEINPDVVRIARDTFSFLRDSPANVQVILGDARLSLQRESPQQFDLLILDAFSGDAIPVHLLTHECFELYQRHLRPGGIIAVHISNQHLDLAPVVLKLAEHFNLSAAQIISPPDAKNGQYQADWLLVTSDKAWLSSPPIRTASTPVRPHASALRLWTDDDTNLFQILN